MPSMWAIVQAFLAGRDFTRDELLILVGGEAELALLGEMMRVQLERVKDERAGLIAQLDQIEAADADI